MNDPACRNAPGTIVLPSCCSRIWVAVDEAKAGRLFTADRGQENGSRRFGRNDGVLDGGDAGGAVGKTRLRSQIRRDHGKIPSTPVKAPTSLSSEVRDNEFDPRSFHGSCFRLISDDAADLFTMLKQSAYGIAPPTLPVIPRTANIRPLLLGD